MSPEPSSTESSAANAPARRIVCTVPTYNEAENILRLSEEILALGPGLEVLVIDDDSPDGTAALVEKASRAEPRLHLLLRTEDRGRGRAGRDGFVEALAMGADVVIEMDADFSHPPGIIPELLERLDRCGAEVGLVLGSRAVEGGSDDDRSSLRQLITRLANAYVRILLSIPVADCNSGFRCWRAQTLRKIEVERAFSVGPEIVHELLYKTARAGIPIAEVGIEFVDRKRGDSTLGWRTLIRSYATVMRLRFLNLVGRL